MPRLRVLEGRFAWLVRQFAPQVLQRLHHARAKVLRGLSANPVEVLTEDKRRQTRAGPAIVRIAKAGIDAHTNAALRVAFRLAFWDFGLRLFSLARTPCMRRSASSRSALTPVARPRRYPPSQARPTTLVAASVAMMMVVVSMWVCSVFDVSGYGKVMRAFGR